MTLLNWLTLRLIVLRIIMCTEISKSTDLDLSVLSMNQHYLELQTYLSEVETYPEIVFDRCFSLRKTDLWS